MFSSLKILKSEGLYHQKFFNQCKHYKRTIVPYFNKRTNNSLLRMRFLEIVQNFSRFLAGNVTCLISYRDPYMLLGYTSYILSPVMVLSIYMRLLLHTYSVVQADTGGRAV